MTPELWQQVSRSLQEIMDRPAEEHAALLENLRRQDATVGAEVESLLRQAQTPETTEPWTVPAGLRDALAAPARVPEIPGYEILGELGKGGMGVVYKARHLALNRIVALKFLKGGWGDKERFRREALSVAEFHHPNIVPIFEIGEHDGNAFFSLEYMQGGTLAKKINGTPQPAKEAAAIVAVLARAIQVAHQAGIIHRDLKPANVLLAADGTPKLADFGLAKKIEEPGLTMTGVAMGTPSYMAPEQAAGKTKEIAAAADLYGLGACLYELLTGRPPFRGESQQDTINQVLHEEPVPPRRLNPKAPRDLETICLKCLQKVAKKRYATAAELADDLDRYLNGAPIHARPVGRVERAWRWCRRKPGLALASGLAVLLLLALATVSTIFVLEKDRDAAALSAKSKELDYYGRRTTEFAVVWPVLRLELGQRLQPAELEQLGKVLKVLEGAPPDFLPVAEMKRFAVSVGYMFSRDPKSTPQELKNRDAAWEPILQTTIRLWQRYLDANPDDPGSHHELANAYYSLGAFYRNTAQPEKQRAAWLQSAAVSAAAPPVPDANTQYGYASNLGRLYYNLGAMANEQKDSADAAVCQAKAIAVLQPLYQQEPKGTDRSKKQLWHEVKWFYTNAHVGQALALVALERYEEAVPICERAIALETGTQQQEVRLELLALALAGSGQVDVAIREGELGFKNLPKNGFNCVALAQVYALAAQRSGRQQPAADNRAEQYAVRSVALLKQAQRMAYFKDAAQVTMLQSSKIFAALRGREDFRRLLKELEAELALK